MKRITIHREIDAVTFAGRTFECVPVSPAGRMRVLRALSSGRLDHLGACPDISFGCHTTPQVYDSGGGYLLAGAVSAMSQYIDMAWFLHPVRA